MGTLLVIWAVFGIILASLTSRRRASAGLPLAYFLQLSLLHVPGALIYLEPQELGGSAAATMLGFEQTVIGSVAFVVAVIFARRIPWKSETVYQGIDKRPNSNDELARNNRLALYYLLIG